MPPEDLWKIREHKKMSVTQLAIRSGIPLHIIEDYEAGKALTSAHRAKLAKILFIDERDIKLQSTPRPHQKEPALIETMPGPEQRADHAPSPSREPRPPKEPKPAPPPRPARPGQIDYLKALAQRLGAPPAQLEAEVGKPLSDLTEFEARQWIKQYASRQPLVHTGEQKPAGYRSQRAHLPEGLDLFEANYLLEAQQANAPLTIKLFNGEVVNGTLIGFSPYALTLRLDDNSEVTLHKLAIAYYRRERGVA